MRVFVIDTRNMGPELQGGLIGVVGSLFPRAEEKREYVETVSRYATDGWAIAADPRTLIGRLAALTRRPRVCRSWGWAGWPNPTVL
ncbi:hypothetical protein LSHI6S_03217 [Leifsonia shinshuensis]